MGSMALMDATGHVEINWTDNSININMQPVEGKANKDERLAITRMVKSAFVDGLEVFLDNRRCDEIVELGKKVKKILLTTGRSKIKKLLEGLFQADVFSRQIVFQIQNGVGKLEQRTVSDFKVDPADKQEYKAAKPLIGG